VRLEAAGPREPRGLHDVAHRIAAVARALLAGRAVPDRLQRAFRQHGEPRRAQRPRDGGTRRRAGRLARPERAAGRAGGPVEHAPDRPRRRGGAVGVEGDRGKAASLALDWRKRLVRARRTASREVANLDRRLPLGELALPVHEHAALAVDRHPGAVQALLARCIRERHRGLEASAGRARAQLDRRPLPGIAHPWQEHAATGTEHHRVEQHVRRRDHLRLPERAECGARGGAHTQGIVHPAALDLVPDDARSPIE
jgi:hypothetical protein